MAKRVVQEVVKAGLTADKQKMAPTADVSKSAKSKRVIGGPFGIIRWEFNKGGYAKVMPKAKPN